MSDTTTLPNTTQLDFLALSLTNDLACRTSTWNATSILAKLSASGLVIASAGFGCTYAWQSNEPHGVTLASLAVIFAAALEMAKPLAVSGAAHAFRSWRIGQGTALAILACVAIAYSLSAELSLMARSRADATAERAGASQSATYARAKANSPAN